MSGAGMSGAGPDGALPDDETPDTGIPDTGIPDTPRPSARDLVRTRSRSYRRDETGRHHHIGAAPDQQPVLGADGMQYVETADVQLAARTVAQLREQRSRADQQMTAAAAELRFEDAGRWRDDLGRLDAELARRGGPDLP